MVSGGGKRKSKPRGEGAMSLCLQNRGWRREAAEGKQKIKVGGRLVSVREGSEIGEPWAPAHGCEEEEKSRKILPGV